MNGGRGINRSWGNEYSNIDKQKVDFITITAPFNADNVAVANTLLATHVGMFLQSTVFGVTSDGAVITASVEAAAGHPVVGLLQAVFRDGLYDWDVDPAETIALTAGSDTAPTLNYIYLDAVTKVLTVNTTGFPVSEHAPIATVLCQSAASIQADGPYKVHVWTDHAITPGNNGHLSHLNSWIRSRPAGWKEGSALTPTITPQGAAPDNFDIQIDAGVVKQLHEHATPEYDTGVASEVYVINDFTTPNLKIADLNAILADSDGDSLSATRFNLVVWGVCSEDAADSKIMINLPNGSYNKDEDAIVDILRTSNFNIPTDYLGTGYLIARLTVRHTTASGGTWSILQNESLLGSIPSTFTGGTAGTTTKFSDSTFEVSSAGDSTKILNFDIGGVGTGQTRKIFMPDADVVLYANMLAAGEAKVLTAGFAATPADQGEKTTGTFTPNEAGGNFQYAVNGGAHTLAPPVNNSTMIIQYTNNASAGAITTSGFTKVTGDTISTTDGDDFFFYITKCNGFSSLNVMALQ